MCPALNLNCDTHFVNLFFEYTAILSCYFSFFNFNRDTKNVRSFRFQCLLQFTLHKYISAVQPFRFHFRFFLSNIYRLNRINRGYVHGRLDTKFLFEC